MEIPLPLRTDAVDSPELTASAPEASRDATRHSDISDDHSRRKWLNSHALHYQRSLPHGDGRAIYVGHKVDVAFACASRPLQAWSGPPAKAPYFIPGPLLNRHS